LTCRLDYNFENNTCIPNGMNPKCSTFNADLVCVQCYYPEKYYLDNNNICSENQLDCKVFDVQSGDCTECYSGYTLYNGQCVLSTAAAAGTTSWSFRYLKKGFWFNKYYILLSIHEF